LDEEFGTTDGDMESERTDGDMESERTLSPSDKAEAEIDALLLSRTLSPSESEKEVDSLMDGLTASLEKSGI
jgi:hypothetical protein